MSAGAARDARGAENRTAADVARELGPIFAHRASETTTKTSSLPIISRC